MAIIDLYNKKAKVVIGTKVFSSPPFSIRFELSQAISSSSKVNCILYNPNDITIALCESKKVLKKTIFTQARVFAGYETSEKLTAEGSIKKFDVYRKGQNRILDMQIFDNKDWRDKLLNKTFSGDVPIQTILTEVIGTRPSEVLLGNPSAMVTDYRVKTRYEAIDKLSELSDSQFAIRNGTVVIKPIGFKGVNAYNLNYKTGLVEIPEKIDRPKTATEPAYNGYKIKTLYIAGLQIWSSVLVTTPSTKFNGVVKPGLNFTGIVLACRKVFSTFENSVSEYDVRITS